MTILFPYMARWAAANRTRYHHLLGFAATAGHEVHVFQAPPRQSAETNFTPAETPTPPNLQLHDVPVPRALWHLPLPADKLAKKAICTLATRASLRHCLNGMGGGRAVLLLYNIPQRALVSLSPGRVALDVADDLPAMLGEELGRAGRPLLASAGRLLRGLAARCESVTAASPPLAAALGGSALVIPNGADTRAAARADGRALRQRSGAPLVGYVGAFEYFVDFGLILDTAARLPGVRFLLVGGGRALGRVRRQVRSRGLANVVCPGPVPYRLALDHMAALDVCLLPLRAGRVGEAACPLKLFEYAAVGRPIVATPVGEACRAGAGFTIHATTGAEFASVVARLLARPEEARERGERARTIVCQDYAWERLAPRFLAALGSDTPRAEAQRR